MNIKNKCNPREILARPVSQTFHTSRNALIEAKAYKILVGLHLTANQHAFTGDQYIFS